MDPDVLRELGEWMALGFYEGIDLPWPRGFGLAFRRLYENMPITVREGKLIHPVEPLPNAKTEGEHRVGRAVSLILDSRISTGLVVNRDVAEERKARFPQRAAFIDGLVEDLRARFPHFGGYTHTNPDIRRVVDEGFDAMETELDSALAGTEMEIENCRARDEDAPDETWERLNLYLALKDYTVGVRAFHRRTASALHGGVARSDDAEARRMAEAFAGCFLKPAETFIEGLLAVHFTWMLDFCDSIGRVDQVLGPLFEKDLADGRLDLDFTRRLLDEWFRDFERMNGWNLQVGGYTPDGRDGCNALTRELILACGRNHQRRPNVAFRVTRETPTDLVREAIAVLRDGAGRPALYNDDLYVKTLHDMDLGLSPEDAREIGFGGCTETMIAGLSNVGSLEGEINLAKALELALHDGHDSVARRQAGPHTGRFEDFATFEDFANAVKRQIQYLTDTTVARNIVALESRLRNGDPKLNRTFFTRDCVKRGKSFEAGGARYNWAIYSYQGFANLVDSLAAVRRLVFEEGTIDAAELIEALRADFEGREPLRRRLLAAPKFGNDVAWVDELGAEFARFAWETLYQHETPRGGRYLASCILFATYARAGQPVGATPDGRKAGTYLTDSIGPAQGRDTRGPTAMLNSVLSLPLALAVGTPVLNVRFQKELLDSAEGLDAVAALVRSYFDRGGMQIQLSVLDREEMLAAQREPEEHEDLIVRVGGYSEYFVRLAPALQDSVIARTEHALT